MATRWILLLIIAVAMSPSKINGEFIMEGQVHMNSTSEELNLFIAPVEHKRLLSKENCRDSSCQLSMATSIDKTTTKYTLNITNIKPEYTGLLAICVTPKSFSLSIPYLDVRLEKCDTSSLTIISPTENSHSSDDLNVSLFTWYMDHTNYREMTLNNYTQVLIPASSTSSSSSHNAGYNLPLFGAVTTYSGSNDANINCQMYDENGNTYHLTEHREINTRVKHYYSSLSINTENQLDTAMMFSFNCTSTSASVNTNTKGKVLSLKTIKIPSLLILKNKRHTTNNMSPNIIPLVIATEMPINISMVTITRDNNNQSIGLKSHLPPHYINFKYQSSLFHYYDIVFPKVYYYYSDDASSNNGQYTVKVKLHSEQELMERFAVNHTVFVPAPIASKLTGGSTITALPGEKRITNGSSASFECTVTTNVAFEMYWQRQDGNMSQHTAINRISTNSANTRILRLTISSAQFEDTGWYVCIVQIDNKNTSQYVNLLVLPEGSPYLDPNYVDPPSGGPTESSGNSTDIIGIVLDYVKENYIIVGGAGGGALIIIVVLILLVICIVCCKKRKRKNNDNDDESNESTSSEEKESPRTTKRRLAAARKEEERKRSRDRPRGRGGGGGERGSRNGQTRQQQQREGRSNRNEDNRGGGKRNRQK